jgi:hypothetical protein
LHPILHRYLPLTACLIFLGCLSEAAAKSPRPAAEVTSPTVFVFLAVDCPISNRQAPTLQKLQAEFGPRGIDFVAAYPDPAVSAAAARDHLAAHALPLSVRLDPDRILTHECGATVTPEVAVFLPRPGKPAAMIYRGRIDDRFQKLGQDRREPKVHDLRDLLTAVADGRPPAPRTTRAVGCYIE